MAHETLLLLPDYRGNERFHTLGNIALNPKCGLLFIDFETGSTVQVTGEAEILWHSAHTRRFPGAKRVLAVSIAEVVAIENALPIDWRFEGFSPALEAFERAPARRHESAELPEMRLNSVNVSMPKTIEHEGKTVTTGIFKEPVGGRVMLRRMNLDGDGQADLWGHGGAFRAVYVYAFENYAYWSEELGRDDFVIGQFGENFTVEGMLEDDIQIGDVFRVGGALVEVSQPRVPCYKLAIRMGVDGFQNRFLSSGRMGFYFRVLEEGEVGAGDTFELIARDADAMSVRAVNDLLYFDKGNSEATEKALNMPALSHGWKDTFEERLRPNWYQSMNQEPGFREFVVQRIEPESETITSFYLRPEEGHHPTYDFWPGQFLTLELDIPGQTEPILRTYSISDAKGRWVHRVTIKREPAPADRPDLPPGLSSTYFHDRVAVGTKIRVGPPRGKFRLDPDEPGPVVLVSAGVGLTPMVSMLEAIAEETTGPSPTGLVHPRCAQRPRACDGNSRAQPRRAPREHPCAYTLQPARPGRYRG